MRIQAPNCYKTELLGHPGPCNELCPENFFTFNLVFRKPHPTVDTERVLTPWVIFTTVSPTETGAGDSLLLQPQKLRFGDPINSPKLMGRVELTLEFLCVASKHRCLGNGSATPWLALPKVLLSQAFKPLIWILIH